MDEDKDLYFHCSVHPEEMGVVDLGIDVENRYPCRQCYEEIVRQRKTDFIKKHHNKENNNVQKD